MANLAGLPNTAATCSYNGVSFLTLYKSSVSSRPILDEAKRTTIYVEHTLTVEGYVAAPTTATTTDITLATMRKQLTACAGTLVYRNKGFGDLVVNGASNVRDATWGPLPEILEWLPLGGDCNAAKVTWRCVTRIPECDTARYQFALVALNYEAAFDIDESGYTTYRLGGYLEIPMTRTTQSTRTLTDNADSYRPMIRPAVALGFQREQQTFRVSKDKRRLDFQFVDREAPAALPDGVTKCDARHRVSGALKSGAFRVWTTTIEATITLARGLPKTDALAKFLLIVSSRVGATKGAVHIPQTMTFEDDIFGRTAHFSVSLIGFFHLNIAEALNTSSIWRPIAGTNYNSWRASLEQASASGVRGWAGAQNTPQSDFIVDLCMGNNSVTTLKTMPLPNSVPQPGGLLNQPADPYAPVLKTVSADSSWLFYRPNVHYGEQSNLVPHKPLPAPPATSSGGGATLTTTGKLPLLATKLAGVTAVGGALDDATGAQGAADTSTAYPNDVYQRAAAPSRTVIFSGVAARLAYRVPVPKLDTIGGQTAVELRRHTQEFQPGGYGNVQVFGLRWWIEYALPAAPQGALLYVANPEFGTVGGTGVVGSVTP